VTREGLPFTEIEHKYVVDERFDLKRFKDVLSTLNPIRTTTVRVRDRYYLTEGGRDRRFVIRHRYDSELHQLTLKAIESDTEVRTEVNLDLGHHAGDQSAAVEAFLDRLGIAWSGTLYKDLEAWVLPDCEVVYYEASTERLKVRCVEFEALRKESLEDALATLSKYERATGFDGARRSRRSLLELLFPEVTEHLR
jgi:adenylate cyclase class IV